MPCRLRAVLAAGLCALVPAACSSDSHATKDASGADEPKVVAAPAPPSITHVVAEGQTLWDIARAYDLTVEKILEANDMQARDVRRLSTGAKLMIPGAKKAMPVETAAERKEQRDQLPKPEDGAYHFIARGESLWTLARAYDVPIERLMDRNDLDDDSAARLREGQPIVIPGAKPSEIERSDASQARAGITHELVRGETVWDIASSFQVSVAEIMAANALSAEDVTKLRDGRRLFLPGVEADKRGRVRRTVSARDRRAQSVAGSLGLGTRKVAKALLRGRVQPRWARAARAAGSFSGTLRWPVTKGWFVRGYGSGEGGYHLAMDIMGQIGWNVRAAAPGIVAYSGDEVRGYGNTVMVVHPGGFVTMYAHNSVNFVRAGERVARGAILAEVGSTGISRGPHVHFELIHAGKNCDPAPLFRPGVRHRSGKHSEIARARWPSSKKRPRQVRCAPRRRHPRSRWVVHEDPEKQAEGPR